MNGVKNKELITTHSSCRLFVFPRRSSIGLRCHGPVINTNVIDHTREEGTGGEGATNAKIQVGVGIFQAGQWCSVLGNLNSINIQMTT